MLIAQALGEYGALSALSDMYNDGTAKLEEAVGTWGNEAIFAAVAAFIVWKLISAPRTRY